MRESGSTKCRELKMCASDDCFVQSKFCWQLLYPLYQMAAQTKLSVRAGGATESLKGRIGTISPLCHHFAGVHHWIKNTYSGTSYSRTIQSPPLKPQLQLETLWVNQLQLDIQFLIPSYSRGWVSDGPAIAPGDQLFKGSKRKWSCGDELWWWTLYGQALVGPIIAGGYT